MDDNDEDEDDDDDMPKNFLELMNPLLLEHSLTFTDILWSSTKLLPLWHFHLCWATH